MTCARAFKASSECEQNTDGLRLALSGRELMLEGALYLLNRRKHKKSSGVNTTGRMPTVCTGTTLRTHALWNSGFACLSRGCEPLQVHLTQLVCGVMDPAEEGPTRCVLFANCCSLDKKGMRKYLCHMRHITDWRVCSIAAQSLYLFWQYEFLQKAPM